jgi:hypothetical protein
VPVEVGVVPHEDLRILASALHKSFFIALTASPLEISIAMSSRSAVFATPKHPIKELCAYRGGFYSPGGREWSLAEILPPAWLSAREPPKKAGRR